MSQWKETLRLWAFGFLKIPMLWALKPRVIAVSDARVEICLPLSRASRNHLGSMYFGALSAGADCAGGLIAMRLCQARGMNLVFKDFHAEFLKRAEGDTHFVCNDGEAIRALVEKAEESGGREQMPVHVVATVPSQQGTEPVARFTLTLSLKRK